jgi:L-threonylcarbamoyladenylate synthase
MITTHIVDVAAVLKKEDIVAIPTETVYGLAGNIFSEKAIKKIFALKNRPLFNPLIVHIKSIASLSEVAMDIPEVALTLTKAFWPGPLTLVLKKQPHIPDLITAGKPTVAVRMPNHKTALSLLNMLDFPLAAPSANPFGSISPTTAQHVEEYFKDRLQLVLDGGPCERGVESTIIGFDDDGAVLYRYGSISMEEIENVIGKIKIITKNNSSPNAPGMLLKHYAPKTPIIVVDDVKKSVAENPDKKLGVLIFKEEKTFSPSDVIEILSKKGDLKEAAGNLYAAMHRLDHEGLDLIIAEKFPETGLGKTINDRLERATK